MARASARHILVHSEKECKELKSQIERGAEFAKIAQEHSKCPSGQKGGDLGSFTPGSMVPAFDKVIFSAELGKVHGPVKTEFGFHLIEITKRTGKSKTEEMSKGEESTEESTESPQGGEDEAVEEEEIKCFEIINSVAKAVKGLGCRDFFFFKPLIADSNLVNAYQDHINTVQTFVKTFEEADLENENEVVSELLLRLRLVMREIKEKIIDPIQKETTGDDELKTFNGYAVKWNEQVSEAEKIDKALSNKYEYGKPLKIKLAEDKSA